ncbi:MAG: pyridoxamine 5'-phosphate oxidase family protein [Pseudomonadota bacterium]
MAVVTELATLESLYGETNPKSLLKVSPTLTPCYRAWIAASRFAVLSTIGPEGTDGSPRGDDGPVVQMVDGQTLLLPDWKGNNRLDSLRNIVADGRVSLMFMIHGSVNVVRVNGHAVLKTDPDLLALFDKAGKRPATVTEITVGEVYYQCAKALMRSKLWTTQEPVKVPTAGDFNKEADPSFDSAAYDAGYAEYAKPLLW